MYLKSIVIDLHELSTPCSFTTKEVEEGQDLPLLAPKRKFHFDFPGDVQLYYKPSSPGESIPRRRRICRKHLPPLGEPRGGGSAGGGGLLGGRFLRHGLRTRR